MKKLISFFMSVVLILACIPISSFTTSAATAAGYVWPVDGGSMSQGWYPAGNSYGHSEHLAIDIADVAAGTTVKAVNSGTVVCASTASASATHICGTCNRKGAGYHVAIKHSDGCISHYAHLSSVSVSYGATVSAGQKIGGVGNTGNSNGAHLHFAIFVGGFGQEHLINPLTKISPFSSVYAANITSNSATLYGTLGAYGSRIDQAGFYIGTSTSNMAIRTENIYTEGKDAAGNWITGINYSTSKWYGTLCGGTTYYYRVWMSAYGNTYLSDVYSFKTTGAATHTWNSGTVTKTATCGATGIKQYTCTKCSSTKTETIAATGNHSFKEKVLTKKASSTEAGKYTYTCSVCNYEQYENIPKVATPSAPTVESKTETSVTLKQVNGYEYSKNGENWQSSNKFTDLTAGKTYTFYQRVAATDISYAGTSSDGTSVTLDAVLDPNIVLSTSENTFGVLGDFVKVPINVDKNEGFITLGLTVEYDSSVLEIYCPGHQDGTYCSSSKIAIEKKEDLSAYCSNSATNSQYHTANPYNLQWAYGLSTEDITYEGEIAVITFKVKDSAKLGNTQVKIYADQATNQKGEKLGVKGTTANINILEQPPCVLGDVDDSGEINLVDLVCLAQYVAKWDVNFNENAMDVNGDAVKDLTDLVLLAQYIADWDVEFKDSSVLNMVVINEWGDKFINGVY